MRIELTTSRVYSHIIVYCDWPQYMTRVIFMLYDIIEGFFIISSVIQGTHLPNYKRLIVLSL